MALGIFKDFVNSAVAACKTIVNVVHDVSSTLTKVVRVKFRELKKKYSDIDIQKEKENRFDELKNINDQIIDLERKYARDGKLTENDMYKLHELQIKREKLKNKVDNAKEYEAAQDIDENEDKYEKKKVDEENPNELIRLGGQMFLNKKCKYCQSPMSIRWKTSIKSPTLNDLFWGCSSFFMENKKVKCPPEKLSKQDKEIFSNFNREGFDLSSEKLNRIVLSSEQFIKKRLQYSINDVTDNYLCPIHHERMQLKQKKNAEDILDLHFLKCPRCDQMVKIKTPAQLDSILTDFTDKGLF